MQLISNIQDFRRNFLFNNIQNLGFPAKHLEIGAFTRPTLFPSEVDIHFADYYSTEELKTMTSSNLDKDMIVNVDFVCKDDNLEQIPKNFYKLIIANHVLEHVDFFIDYLFTLHNLLIDEGYLFITLPDKKYNFDRFRCDTSISMLLYQWLNKFSLKEYSALDASIFYDMEYISQSNFASDRLNLERLKCEIKNWHPGVHIHCFQAENFIERILNPILNFLPFELVNFKSNKSLGEFIFILKKIEKATVNLENFYSISSDTFKK